jgi:hypothetical protein
MVDDPIGMDLKVKRSSMDGFKGKGAQYEWI